MTSSQFINFLAATLTLSTLTLYAGIPDSVVIVPQPGGDFAATGGDQDPLLKCPSYTISSKEQILVHGGYEGADDYRASVRFALSDKELVGSFNLADDVIRIDPAGKSGDRIIVRLASLTSGPIKTRTAANPYDQITLYPQPEKEACRVVVEAQDAGRLGAVTAALTRTIDGYGIILRIPYGDWELQPRFGGLLRCQIEFVDADDKIDPTIDNHRFTLFPVPRAIPGGEAQTRYFGQLKFVEKVWARLTASDIISSGTKATYLANWGNLTDEALTVEIRAAVAGSGVKGKSWPVAGDARELAPGTSQTDVAIELDLSELPKGATYDFKSVAGRLFETSPHPLTYTDSLNICMGEHGITAPPVARAVSTANDIEAIRAIAGGGSVLWHAGAYNATGADQKLQFRPKGPLAIKVVAGAGGEVPFALLGGRDPLDGMNEPLVLNLDDSLRTRDPLIPITLAGGKYEKAQSKKSRLLLIGLACDYLDEDGFPEIVVKSGEKELLHQTLKSPAADGPGSRHSYVLRIWLEDRQKEIQIENVSAFGPRAEIDFLAIVGGGDMLSFRPGEPSLQFGGSNAANVYSAQLAASLYFLRNFLIDDTGKVWSSLPGGRYGTASPMEYGMLLSELSQWGATDDARRMLASLENILGSNNRDAAGQLTTVTGMCKLWQHSDGDSQLLQQHWIRHILRTIGGMEADLRTNPLGLMNGQGEFGVDGNRAGTTVPIYAAAATALRTAITVARSSSYSQSAPPLERTLSELDRNFRKQLIVEDRDLKITSATSFPTSWSIPAGSVIALLGKGNLIYGRYEDGKPLLYNGDTRVFDTPYLFSALSILADTGFSLPADLRDAFKASYEYQQTFSPLSQQRARRAFGIIDYKTLATHHWSTMAELQIDNLNIANRSIEMLIAASFDEDTEIPFDAEQRPSASISPYIPGEMVNLSPNGIPLGMSGDEMNAMIGVQHLRLARMIAGIDDADINELHITPRLPEGWQFSEVNNWQVVTSSAPRGMTTVASRYERSGPNRYALTLKSGTKLQSVTVRFGPFDVLTRTVRIAGGGVNATVTPVKEGLYSWVTRTFENVNNLDVTAQAR